MLADSEIYNRKQTDVIVTEVPMLNVAFSGELDGGMSAGVLQIAGPSKHFKTGFSLLMARSFLKKNPDGIILFYDSEFGSPASYFSAFGVNSDQVVHSPVMSLEKLRHDLITQLEGLTDKDKVFILIDSIGNTASDKETEDALKKDASPADFTRAKTLKSLFRMITPRLIMKNIPMLVINHIYMTMEKFAKAVVGGGTGSVYNSDNIWIIGRQQDSDDDGLNGWKFVVNIQKSRFVKEKAKFVLGVNFEDGIDKNSGLFEEALEAGFVAPGKKGFYVEVDDDGVPAEIGRRKSDFETNQGFINRLLTSERFKEHLRTKFKIGNGAVIEDSNYETEE
jgi:RecA/RadA recombinase